MRHKKRACLVTYLRRREQLHFLSISVNSSKLGSNRRIVQRCRVWNQVYYWEVYVKVENTRLLFDFPPQETTSTSSPSVFTHGQLIHCLVLVQSEDEWDCGHSFLWNFQNSAFSKPCKQHNQVCWKPSFSFFDLMKRIPHLFQRFQIRTIHYVG